MKPVDSIPVVTGARKMYPGLYDFSGVASLMPRQLVSALDLLHCIQVLEPYLLYYLKYIS